MSAPVDPDELVGVAEIADATGVTRSRVSQWAMSERGAFPAPVAHLAAGPVWTWPAVAGWLEETGRMTRNDDGGPVHSPAGPYERLALELAEVAGFVDNGYTPYQACHAVASHRAASKALPVRTMAARLRHLYPGWKARERTTT